MSKVARVAKPRAPPKRLRAAREAAAGALPTEPQFEIARLKDRLNLSERQKASMQAELEATQHQLAASRAREAAANIEASRTREVQKELEQAREESGRLRASETAAHAEADRARQAQAETSQQLTATTCELAHSKATLEEERAHSRRADAAVRQLQHQLHEQQRELESLRRRERSGEAAQQVQH